MVIRNAKESEDVYKRQIWNSSTNDVDSSVAQNEASIDEKFFLIRCGTVSQKGGIYMKAKKLVAVGMTVLMLGGLFVGCGNSADTSTGANSGKNVKITIFQSKIEANEGYKKLIAAYEKDQMCIRDR